MGTDDNNDEAAPLMGPSDQIRENSSEATDSTPINETISLLNSRDINVSKLCINVDYC